MYDPNDVATGLETRLMRLKPRLILILIVLPLIPLLIRCPCHRLWFGTHRGGGVHVCVWMVVVVMWRCGA